MHFTHILRNTFFASSIPLLTLAASAASCAKTSVSEQPALPLTSEEVGKYLHRAEEKVLQTIHSLVSIPDDQKTSENMLKPWNRLSNEILTHFSVLTFITKSDFPSKIDAGIAIQKLQAFLFKSLIQNPDLYRSLMTYIDKSLTGDAILTPYEHQEIHCLLESCEQIKGSLSKEDQETLDKLKDLNSKHEKAPFVYLKSDASDKTGVNPPEEFTVLSLNTCFVPGNFPLLFGGVYLPWQKRVSPLAEKILSINADVVCLQEVHAEDASYALYEKLKNDYSYFYMAMGPRVLGFSLDTLGLPSGLFVASKYPIENPQFTLFSTSGFPMNYGFFDFIVKNGKTSIGHIYTTHTQSLNYDQFAQIRALQLKQILEKMESDLAVKDEAIPFFLCGDLNIPFGSQEPGELLIRTYFYDDYNKNQEPINESNRTCTDYFTNYFFSPDKNPKQVDPNFQIIDYALLLRSLPSVHQLCQKCDISTVQIPMNDLRKPESAISDHHALLTTITMPTLFPHVDRNRE
ncbi:MAG TPA: endonuclease/exonuclease/phosphatase family protein [Chlamydiales bacterium]|nr:endonuclease/exonuclease/phosphatase family protein [Chlamydiales bacterium]